MYPPQYIPFPQGNYTFEFGIYHFHGVFLYFYYISIFFNIVWFALHVFEFYRSCFLSILSFFNLLFFYPISRLMHTNTCDKTALLLFFLNLFIGGRDHIARIYFPDLFIDKCSHMTESI